MLIYTIDYDNLIIEEKEMGDVCNLEAFNREMDEVFDEWFDNIADAEATLKDYVNLD